MQYPVWQSENGEKISCEEKIKVMQENLDELSQIAQDAFEDGILMGISENQLRNHLSLIINNLKNPYK